MSRSASAEGTRTGYAGWWADGIYFNMRLTDERPCLLVPIGTQDDGTKQLVAIHDGERESKQSWKEMHQRCWVHKTANVLDKLPKKVQTSAKRQIHEMYMASTKIKALAAYEVEAQAA